MSNDRKILALQPLNSSPAEALIDTWPFVDPDANTSHKIRLKVVASTRPRPSGEPPLLLMPQAESAITLGKHLLDGQLFCGLEF